MNAHRGCRVGESGNLERDSYRGKMLSHAGSDKRMHFLFQRVVNVNHTTMSMLWAIWEPVVLLRLENAELLDPVVLLCLRPLPLWPQKIASIVWSASASICVCRTLTEIECPILCVVTQFIICVDL